MSRFLENKFLYFISLLCLLLLFLPKVNLINFDHETAGIRIDDLFLVVFCFFLGVAFFFNNKKFSRFEINLLYIVSFSLISFLINGLLVKTNILHVQAKIFYVFRILEYFLFFYIGQMAASFVSMRRIVKIFVLLNTALMLLQKFGLIGRITEIGSQSFDTYRVSGVASFPSEMGGLLSMIFSYLLFSEEQSSGMRNFSLFILFSILIALTGARIALASIVIVYSFYLLNTKRVHFQKILLFGIPILLLFIPVAYNTLTHLDSLYERSVKLFSTNNMNIISATWNSVDTKREMYDNIQLTSGDYDMSWWIRLHKWCYALKMYLNHPECYLQGIGPGVFSAAVDGSFVRILTENGLIGCIVFWNFFSCIYHSSKSLKWVILSFLLNMIFFDIYLAYKTMSFLFLITGYNAALTVEKPKNLTFRPTQI